ncbi:transmembrane protein, putative (macronuclear) [Tetrahymena thermophila SB210]|uniref:Transmembrane protein, putative n=1 Tax=Tetrahymena thermophila (strain SB210) TaxID=312017 RepID=Q236N5_TETTS|nr:transmembrane protein, putative [Tetrahymena thermophila SB210]EAR92465.2 transmembrane protein, putative [Tetrahymena thermophila SB210]|eukprot:XP_001012710.2 transmembrane protein, putative [Tetrahymena thermophila SB210]
MINFEFFYSMQIINSRFRQIQQKIPIIQITYAQKIIITNMVVSKSQSFKFMLISLVNSLNLSDLEFFGINELQVKNINQYPLQNIQDPVLFNKDPSLYNQLDQYLLNFGGIDNAQLSNLTINFCYNVGMLNLNYFQVGQNTIQNSNILQANNIKIYNCSSIMKEPAINLGNSQSIISQLKIYNLSFHSNIMNLFYLQNFNLCQSEFMNIILQSYSTTIYNYETQLIQISEIKFQNISSIQSVTVFLTKFGDKIIIQNCTFEQNRNILGDSSKLIIDNQSIFNIQNYKYLEVLESIFIENTGFGNGGAMYVYQVQKSLIQNTKFILNQALENSGGAIYASNSKIKLDQCTFKDNISRKERGGAIFSDNTQIFIKKTMIINNIAYIGGGIYYNQQNSLEIDKLSQIYKNQGKFYGSNFGSYPKKLLQIDLSTKQVYNKIIIKNFQSGNYTKQPIYVQYFDEQNEMLNFNIAEQINLLSLSIKEELENYKIQIGNLSETKNLTILLGQELVYIKKINAFQLNITAGNIFTTDFQLFLFSEFSGQYIVLDLLLNFRKCQKGEILYPKQRYISCDKCVEGTYSLVDPNIQKNNFKIQCQQCSNIYFKQCYSDQIILQDNYWREQKDTDVIYQCQMLGCSESAPNQINGCIQGYVGPLCNACDYKGTQWGVNYAQKGKLCQVCGKQANSYIYLAIIILLYSLYIKMSVNSQIQSHLLMIQIDYLRKMNILFLSKTKLRGSDTGIILKIFFHYLQIFSSSIDIFYQIPDLVGNIFKLGGDPSQITYTNLDCIYKDWIISQLWFNRLTMQIAQLIIITGLVLSYRYLLQKNNQKFYKKETYLLFIYFFFYSSIAKLLVSLCVCKKIGFNYYMLNDHLQKCWTYKHVIFQVGIIYPLTIIWSILIPLMFSRKIKSAIQKKEQNKIQFIQTYYFIYQGYKQKFYFWEVLKMFQRLIIMAVLNLDMQNIVQRLIILSICFTQLKITMEKNPYQQKQSRNLEILLQTTVIFSLILQILIYIFEEKQFIHFTLIIIIIIINFYNLLKISFEYYKSALDLILKSKNRKTKRFLSFLYKIKIIKFDVNKNQIQLSRICYLWKKLYINRKNLIYQISLNSQKSSKNSNPKSFTKIY